MDNTNSNQPQIDTSVKKLAILPNGETALITGRGLSVSGSQGEIDITDISPEDERHLRANLQDIRVSQKGDKITLRPRSGRALTIKGQIENGA